MKRAKSKTSLKNKGSSRDFWDNIKNTNIHYRGPRKRRETERKGQKKYLMNLWMKYSLT